MADSPLFTGALATQGASLVNSDGTSFKTLLQAHVSNGSRVKSICVCSDDTSDVVLQFALLISAVSYRIGEVSIPDGSGTNGTDKAVKVLNLTDMPWLQQDGFNTFVDLAPGQIIQVRAKTAVTSAKTIWLTAEIGDL